eukprot:8474678-Pyramimonas_sp.AAC.1
MGGDTQHGEDAGYVCGYCAAVVGNLAAHARPRRHIVNHERVLEALVEATRHQVGPVPSTTPLPPTLLPSTASARRTRRSWRPRATRWDPYRQQPLYRQPLYRRPRARAGRGA